MASARLHMQAAAHCERTTSAQNASSFDLPSAPRCFTGTVHTPPAAVSFSSQSGLMPSRKKKMDARSSRSAGERMLLKRLHARDAFKVRLRQCGRQHTPRCTVHSDSVVW